VRDYRMIEFHLSICSDWPYFLMVNFSTDPEVTI